MTQNAKNILIKWVLAIGISTIAGLIFMAGGACKDLRSNTKFREVDAPEIQKAIITTSIDVGYLKEAAKEQKESSKKQEETMIVLTESVQEVLFIYRQNQRLARNLEDTNTDLACETINNGHKNL